MAGSTLLICLAVAFSGLFFLPQGYGLKCYNQNCVSSTSGTLAPCNSTSQACPAGQQCQTMLISYTNAQGTKVSQDMRGCTMSVKCTPRGAWRACDGMATVVMRQQGGRFSNFKCAQQCCQGELCNSDSFVPGMDPVPTGTPAPLQCYACDTGPGTKGCDNPQLNLKTCPVMYGRPNSCLTLTVNTTMMIRNCTTTAACGQICSQLGHSDCTERCCSTNGCNSQGLNLPTTPAAGGMTTSSEAVKPVMQVLAILSGLLWALVSSL